MKTHELRIWPQFFDDVVSGTKKYEVRREDRGFQTGDRLMLVEWDPLTKEYSGRQAEFGIVHITSCAALRAICPDFPAFCVLGIERLP